MVALVGTPNCGKTALFNALTGSHQKVANYAGVTVERKEGEVEISAEMTGRDRAVLNLLDLPGTMSLRARSPDEAVTRDVVLGRREDQPRPDLVVCVGDAMNLRPTLRLVLELKRTGIPVLLTINMIDIARARGKQIDLNVLSRFLDVPVVTSVAVRRGGTTELLKALAAKLETHGFAHEGGGRHAHLDAWSEPSANQIRVWHVEAEQILKMVTVVAGEPPRATWAIDKVALHPVGGVALLLTVLFLIFQSVFTGAAPLMDFIDNGFKSCGDWIGAILPDGHVKGLLVDGVIAGVGGVLVFLPQIVILFTCIIFLEDFGYMARAAFLMDRLMGRAGLHGRAFIPLLSSFACAIPGIMATRTIENPRDRLATIMIAPFMTCSARVPVYTLIVGAMIPDQYYGGIVSLRGLVMFGLYACGILGGLIVAMVLKRTVLRAPPEPLMLTLPDYKRPSWRNIGYGVWMRTSMFIKRAGTIIFAMAVMMWFLATFPAPPEGATGPAIDYSFAGQLGHFLAPVMAPIGFTWQMTLSLIPAMAAREVAVATLATIYAVGGGEGGGEALSLGSVLGQSWSLAAGLAYLMWFVFAPQCLSTLAVVRRETNGLKWPVAMFVTMSGLAYAAAFATYQIARSWFQ
ncbi:MAG: ferrous iron transporter B [Bdellovibrionales bacterium]